jgi:hypothetical protein
MGNWCFFWKRVVGLMLCFTVLGSALFGQEEPPKDHDTSTISPLFMPVFWSPLEPIFIRELTYNPVNVETVLDVQYANPLLMPENIYQTLGVSGQAHKPMGYDQDYSPGFKLLTFPYPLLVKQQKDLRFYKLETVYTKLAYNFGILVPEHEFYATHAQYIRGLTIVANLAGFIRSKTSDYVNNNSGNMEADILLHYELPSHWYGFRVGYIFNRLTNGENGGLQNYSDTLLKQYNSAKTPLFPVFSDYGNSKLVYNDVMLQQYVNLSVKNKKGKTVNLGSISHTLQFQHLKDDYTDSGIDSTYYPSYLFAESMPTPDTLMTAIKYYLISNTVQWSSLTPYTTFPDKSYFLHLNFGLTHEYAKIYYPSYTLNTVTPYAQTHIRLFRVMDIYARMSYTFLDYNKNDALASVKIQWAFNKQRDHFVGLEASYNRISPDFLLSKSAGFIFKTDSIKASVGQMDSTFSKQNFLKLSAYWQYKRYFLHLNYFMEYNRVQLGADGLPFVNNKYVSIIQAQIYAPLKIKNFGLIANLYLQYSNNKFVPVPLFAGKLATYYQFIFFNNNLKVKIGIDMMYNTPYYANGYNAPLHQFYYQDQYKTGNFFYMDANVSVQVQRIAFYFRVGNVWANILGYNYFTTPSSPMQRLSLTIGINWRFYD